MSNFTDKNIYAYVESDKYFALRAAENGAQAVIINALTIDNSLSFKGTVSDYNGNSIPQTVKIKIFLNDGCKHIYEHS